MGILWTIPLLALVIIVAVAIHERLSSDKLAKLDKEKRENSEIRIKELEQIRIEENKRKSQEHVREHNEQLKAESDFLKEQEKCQAVVKFSTNEGTLSSEVFKAEVQPDFYGGGRNFIKAYHVAMRELNHSFRNGCFINDKGQRFPVHNVKVAWVEEVIEKTERSTCCKNERRNWNGGCDNCGDPCY